MNPENIARDAFLSPIYRLLKETPLQPARRLGASLGWPVLLKREDMHPIFSFKVRGACHKILRMPERERRRGVVTASAGNHAQGVAYAARECGIKARIYMPATTPAIKVEAVAGMGAEVCLDEPLFSDALAAARKFAARKKIPLVHPFDDADIISGQATVGLELLRELDPATEAVFVCCGGGGLLSGIATIIKRLRPEIKVIGVEPDDAASMTEALRRGKPCTLPYVGTFAETAAVARAGNLTFKLCQEHVDDMLTVDIGSICNAIKEIYEDTRVIVEPAGALAVAGARVYAQRQRPTGKALVAIVSGANMNFDALRHVVERATAGTAGEMLLAAEIPERPGSFLHLCRLLGDRHVTEFNYRHNGAAQAHVFIGLELKHEQERRQVLAKLRAAKIRAVELTGDETAELHVRHMVGGRAALDGGELAYRFEFPERAGALEHFLTGLDQDWNISLFHYRFHGASVGRVMVGFQLPAARRKALEQAFRRIGYNFWRVENSAAYDMFLASTTTG